MSSWLECVTCHRHYPADEIRYTCDCGGLLSLERTEGWARTIDRGLFDSRRGATTPLDRSGVWRFREAVLDADEALVVCHPEGGTNLYQRSSLSDAVRLEQLWFKHEGENPTGSFKDRGMTVA